MGAASRRNADRRGIEQLGLLAITLIFAVSACAPVFSDLQSAKLVGKGHVEVTASGSTVSFSGDEGTSHIQDQVGIQIATGLSGQLDLRARYEYIWVADDGPSVHVLGFGPKFQFLKNHIAGYLPVGFAFGSDIDEVGDTWQIHPTLLLTANAHRNLEINGSAKYIIPLSGDGGDNLLAFNLGLGFGPDLERWAIRPELGLLFNPGEEGHFTHFSLGVSYKTK
jgi:hypothetical protein